MKLNNCAKCDQSFPRGTVYKQASQDEDGNWWTIGPLCADCFISIFSREETIKQIEKQIQNETIERGLK
jgi:hypothetical protein